MITITDKQGVGSPICGPPMGENLLRHRPGGRIPSLTCSTLGLTTATVSSAGDSYFLVVPNNGTTEGSYGVDSGGNPRPQSAGACLPQVMESCE